MHTPVFLGGDPRDLPRRFHAVGLAQSMDQLIGFRALQGIGAGGLIVGVRRRSPHRPASGAGPLHGPDRLRVRRPGDGGPLLGGFIVDNLSWRWFFYVNIPVGALAVAIVVVAAAPAHPDHASPDP